MAWSAVNDLEGPSKDPGARLDAPAPSLDQTRYSRRGIAIASSFIGATIAAAAGGQALAPIFAVGAIAAMSPTRLRQMAADAAKTKLTLALFVLLLSWIAASTIWSPQTNPKTAIAMIFYLPLLAAFVWCCRGDTEADRKLILRAGAAFVFLLGAWSLFEAALSFPFLLQGRPDGAAGLFQAKKSLSVTVAGLAILIWPIVAAIDKGGGMARFFIAAPILAAAITARLTSTSSIIIAILIAGICYLAARAYPRSTTLFAGLSISSAILAAPRFADWLRAIPAPIEQLLPITYYHRIEIWKNTETLIAQKPWFGWGMDASKTFRDPHDYGIMGVHSLIPWHPHNAGLHLWLETGLVGAALVAALALSITFSLLSRLRDRRAAAGAIATTAAFCIFACVSFGIWQAWFLSTGFAAAGLITALSSGNTGPNPKPNDAPAPLA